MQREIPSASDFPERTPPSAANRAVVELFRAADALRHHFGDLLESHGLTVQQYNVLRILRGAGPEGLPTLEVGERMMERAPGVSRMIARLEDRGWVVRQRCTEDRRRVFCVISKTGLELLTRLDAPIARADESAFGSMTEARRDELCRTLGQLVDALQEGTDGRVRA